MNVVISNYQLAWGFNQLALMRQLYPELYTSGHSSFHCPRGLTLPGGSAGDRIHSAPSADTFEVI